MTGFARAEGTDRGWRWLWEARAVNGRGLDLKLRLPAGLDGIEPLVRAQVGEVVKRGSLQLSLSLRRPETAVAGAVINWPVLNALIEAGVPLVAAGTVAPPRWDGLLALRGVLVTPTEGEADAASQSDRQLAEEIALIGLKPLLADLSTARASEGAALSAIVRGLIDRIDALTADARALAAGQPLQLTERLRQRLNALSGDVSGLDPQRLAQEVALMATRADVTEELDRLGAHVAEARTLLAQGGPVGRRFDFLAQEFHREANTLGSKAVDIGLTRLALDLKTTIDQLKEQAANVE